MTALLTRWRTSPDFRDNVAFYGGLLVVVVVLACLNGCASEPPQPPQRLVCKIDGAESYRSEPQEHWATWGNTWESPGHLYRQAANESCHTEAAP